MEKWADYCISAVQYDADRNHIEEVEVREDKGDTLGEASKWKRETVASSIKDGKTFVTILKGSNGKWEKGEDVHAIEINNKEYIRTDANKEESDNLGDLPEF